MIPGEMGRRLPRPGGAGAASCRRMRLVGGYSRRHRGRGHGVQRSHDHSWEMPGATWAGPRTESTTFLENEGSFVLLEHKHYRVGEWWEKLER